MTTLQQIIRDLLDHIDDEIEQRKHGGNGEDWGELQALSDRAHAAIRVERKPFPDADVAVTLTGYEWTAILGRIVRPRDLSEFGRERYQEATRKLREQLLAASDRHPSPGPAEHNVLDLQGSMSREVSKFANTIESQ